MQLRALPIHLSEKIQTEKFSLISPSHLNLYELEVPILLYLIFIILPLLVKKKKKKDLSWPKMCPSVMLFFIIKKTLYACIIFYNGQFNRKTYIKIYICTVFNIFPRDFRTSTFILSIIMSVPFSIFFWNVYIFSDQFIMVYVQMIKNCLL